MGELQLWGYYLPDTDIDYLEPLLFSHLSKMSIVLIVPHLSVTLQVPSTPGMLLQSLRVNLTSM